MHRALILAGLLAAPITVSAAGPRPAFQGEEVTLKSEDGLVLSATFYAPKAGHAPAVLLVHDAGADRTQMEEIALQLQRNGLGVLALDLRGHGKSKSDKLDWDELQEKERESLWQLAPRDLDAAAGWLLGRDEIHSTNLNLVGYRAGCALVARHAERDENVVSLTLLSPKPQDFGFDVRGTLHKVNGLPTCVIDRKNDEVERMVTEANALNSHPWIKFETMTAKTPTLLDDKKTASKVAKFLDEIAMPKRGRG